jgi:acyl-CoA synthetase (NDP forming)
LLGGIFVELLKDVSHRVLPITESDAESMLAELRYGSYLRDFRGRASADIAALKDLLLRFSDFLVSNPDIQEAELNPVWVGTVGEGAFALDALIVRASGAA